MQDAIFSQPFEVQIPPMTVAKDRVISTRPEEEVIARLQSWAANQGIDVKQARAFGFDVPVSAEQKAQGIRGYEYWLQVPDSFVPKSSHPEPVEGHHPKPVEGCHPERVEGRSVKIAPFSGGTYFALRITDPFAAPFDRIPQGWQTLVKYIKDNNIKVEWCKPGSCLEEVKTLDDVCCMELMILMT